MIFQALMVPVVAIFGIAVGLFYRGIERILVARMQRRIGPPLQQPFRDVKKLLVKDEIQPVNAIGWLFHLTPIVALTSALIILLYLPLGDFPPLLEGYGDLILVLYLFTLPSLALVIGGFSSASPYADVGAQREVVKMLSYELPLVIASLAVVWLVSLSTGNPFSLWIISLNPGWAYTGWLGWLGLLILLAVLLFVMPGELGSVPFDLQSADSEIAGGLLAEYSGRNLALYYLADVVKTIAFASLIIALFLPFQLSNFLPVSGLLGSILNLLFWFGKIFMVIFLGSTLPKVITGRLKIDRLVTVYWKYAALVALAGFALVGVNTIIG